MGWAGLIEYASSQPRLLDLGPSPACARRVPPGSDQAAHNKMQRHKLSGGLLNRPLRPPSGRPLVERVSRSAVGRSERFCRNGFHNVMLRSTPYLKQGCDRWAMAFLELFGGLSKGPLRPSGGRLLTDRVSRPV